MKTSVNPGRVKAVVGCLLLLTTVAAAKPTNYVARCPVPACKGKLHMPDNTNDYHIVIIELVQTKQKGSEDEQK